MSFLPDKEEWRPIIGFEGFYEVSSRGRVKRLAGTPRCKVDRLLATPIGRGGYPMVQLTTPKLHKGFYVHSLVAEAFHGPRPAGLQINHKDGVKTHPYADNLEYVTPAENMQHALKTGLRVALAGDKHYSTKLQAAQVVEVRQRYADGESAKVLAKSVGLTIQAFYQVVTGQTWKGVGGPITQRGHAKGKDVGSSKLQEDDVRHIRNSDESAKVLAERFGVSTRTIHTVRAADGWGWLK